MGQSLQKLGSDESKDINPIIENCYDKYFAAEPNKNWTSADFYHAISDTVESINKALGSTQFHVPKTATLDEAYYKHHSGRGKSLTKEEFEKILQSVILGTGVTGIGIGIKDLLVYIFGVPATALIIKQRIIPNALPNEFFIPAVTSATVFFLAKLDKI